MPEPTTETARPVNIERKSPWLLAFRADAPVTRRLFCFPYAGGGASIYRRFPESLPPGVEVCAVQLPGREDRYVEPGFTRLPAAVAALADALAPHLRPPFAFFGHSMGALLAFELTRRLAATPGGPRPGHLFVSGRRAPHLPDRRRPLHALPLAEMKAELRKLQGTPAEVLEDPELMALVEPVLRADFALVETYAHEPGAPLDVPITALGGIDDREATRGELEGWEAHTRRFGGVETFPGHHFYLQEQWPAIARAVTRGWNGG